MTLFSTHLTRTIAAVLVVSMLGLGFLRPAPVHAQGASGAIAGAAGAVAGCALQDLIGNALSSAIDKVGELFGSGGGGEDKVPVDDITHNDKQCIMDGLVKAFVNWVLKELTHSIVTWILNGFEGRPAFVTDLKQFLTDAADKAIGEYIYGSDLSFLCDPFELDVRLALALEYQDSTQNPVECTLTDVNENVDDFFAGNFAAGGFSRWFEMTSSPQNDPYGALLAAEAELQVRIADEEFRAERQLSFGEGFLNYEKCDPIDPADHPGRELPEEYCYTTTPGQVISEQLTFQLQTGSLQLIEADEINEAISAIVSALAYKVLETGLTALNDDGYLDSYKSDPGSLTSEGATRVGGKNAIDGIGGPAFGEETVHGGSSATLLWKPDSESDGMLVVLTPTSFGTPSVRILDASGDVIEKGGYAGHHNDNRAHYRFDRPGREYPSDVILAVDGNRYELTAGPGQRNEGRQLRPVTTTAQNTNTSPSPASSPSSGSNDTTNTNTGNESPGGGGNR